LVLLAVANRNENVVLRLDVDVDEAGKIVLRSLQEFSK
jgi:hypothetical protein